MRGLFGRTRYRALATNVGLILFGAAYIQFCRDGVVEYRHFIHGYSMDVLMQIVLYAGGFLLILIGATNRWTLQIILGVALAARLVGVFAPAFLSSDLYRYVWDGRVQAAGVNPYRYIPANPHLQYLRDNQIYPKINRKGYAHTIYPPGAQLLFLGITRISETETCMKAAMIGFDALTCWAILQILKLFGRKREEILLYAWHPLCVWEIGSSGHVDAVALAFLSVAAIARLKDRNLRSAFWITAAAMVKIYPLLLLPALVRRFNARVLSLIAALVVGGYAIYSSVGLGVLGFLSGYAREEGLNTGDRYFFLAWAHRYLRLPLPPGVYIAGSALIVAALSIWAFRHSQEPKRALGYALAIATVVTILFSPHYPWYFLWLLPFAVMLRYLPAIVLTLDAAYWFATYLAIPGEKMFRMNEYMYSIFFSAIAIDLLIRWARRGHPSRVPVLSRENRPPRTGGNTRSVERPMSDTLFQPNQLPQMRRYFEKPDDELTARVQAEPVCLYLETTNRCNLLCTTCPRTFEELEPEADMSWELFTKIVNQCTGVKRVVLHGVGEPMLVKDLPERIHYLKQRNIYVLFNTNGTLLSASNGERLLDTGLDELRVSLDAADKAVFQMVRGRDMFDRIVRNLTKFRQRQRERGSELPRVSLWLTGLRETIGQLEAFVRLAHQMDVPEVYLQRLVFFDENPIGLARAESALFERTTSQEEDSIRRAEELARSLGVAFSASGATEPGTSIKKHSEDQPWSLCRRPWTLMYFTATGRALPCCIAPFSMHGYDSFTLGDATQQSLREIWNGDRYVNFRASLMSAEPPRACANCGLRWSL